MGAFDLLFGPQGWGGLLLEGALVTIVMAVAAAPLGFGGGLALAVLKVSPRRTVRRFCEAYSTFFRGIPDVLSLFIVYFGLQALINKLAAAMGLGPVDLNAFGTGVVALAVVVAAYSSEVWVGALSGVPKGQREAAESLGLDRRQTFWLVLLPQLIRIAIPGLGNVWTILLKDTSLISTLAVMDLLRAAFEASHNTTNPLLFFSAAAAIYLLFTIVSGVAQSWLERRVNRGYA